MSAISEGRVFVLLGTSSAGKSSIIRALKDADPSWVEIGPDLAGFIHMADMIQEVFPFEYEKMSKALDHAEIAHAIVDVFYKSKEGRDSDLKFLHWKSGDYSKSEILKLIQEVATHPAFIRLDQSMYTKETAEKVNQKMIDFVRANSNQGRSVVVDGSEIDRIRTFIEQIGSSVKIGLAYLPLHHLVDRVTKRNETAKSVGDDAEIRSYEQVTRQFFEHFKRAEKGDPVIGHISLEKIEKAFGEMQPKDQKEESALRDLKAKVIEEYKLTGQDKIPLTSRFPYSILIKTKKPPEESIHYIAKL